MTCSLRSLVRPGIPYPVGGGQSSIRRLFVCTLAAFAVLSLLSGSQAVSGASSRTGEEFSVSWVTYDPDGKILTASLYPEDLSGDYHRYVAEIERIANSPARISVIVLNLHTTEHEMQRFFDAVGQNRSSLAVFSGNDDRIERLQRLEIHWLDESNPYETNTKVYEGEALHQKIRDLLASSPPAPVSDSQDDDHTQTTAAFAVILIISGAGFYYYQTRRR
ncbi:MAG: hypothetical protein BWX50_01374 [Euryarchaeota archaeon ADurb.Bin009]|nr:MAG: hypothetical protein BWX50_01374 [Euryarchaeota archaeon ADurb.Bin009]